MAKGLYSFVVDNTIKYIGRSHDPFYKRVNQGYGHISPKNCFRDGQSTNCRINSIIAKNYHMVKLFICTCRNIITFNRVVYSFLKCKQFTDYSLLLN